jgi:transposase
LQRDLARLHLINDQIREIEAARRKRLEQRPDDGAHPMVRLLARVIGIGIETADMLVQEILSRNLRDRRAVARYGGLTGSPDESGARRREKGLARAGNARVRRGMIQLAWRFLMFQKDSALAQWYGGRTADARGATRKTMIIALARKLLVALWQLVTTGEIPHGVASLTESQNSTSCICVSKRPQDVVFGAIFFRIGGPEWTAGRVRGVKRDLRPMSRRSARCWAMPIDKRRCAITAWGC